jgi:hypothetical protein
MREIWDHGDPSLLLVLITFVALVIRSRRRRPPP